MLRVVRSAAAPALAIGLACAAGFPSALGADGRVPRSAGLASKKGEEPAFDGAAASIEARVPEIEPSAPPLLATLVQTHTPERVPLDWARPNGARFAGLLADRVTGKEHPFDPRLVDLLRTLAIRFTGAGDPASSLSGAPRIELVSGFRSPKLNEMLRKKGHHVASHSQHSLGSAVDFRVVVTCDALAADDPTKSSCARFAAIDPRVVAAAIRASGWTGGVGTYTSKDDWFTHADVGPNRAWHEGPNVAMAAMARDE